MQNVIARFIQDESGVTAIEYALIASLIALAIITGAGALGNSVNGKYKFIGNTLNTSGS
ncbi:Flp family type IVb pilin [Mesorhizobium sangaii]|uniref:Flp family type IVb pilin n=1 Tax=Mesorhizobium sangaii TaxID=505389 RepID=UPI001613D66F|nr:Flp family type IVb pilin [Mesorhizobium sangaii]